MALIITDVVLIYTVVINKVLLVTNVLYNLLYSGQKVVTNFVIHGYDGRSTENFLIYLYLHSEQVVHQVQVHTCVD